MTAGIYRAAAAVTARLLSVSPAVESVLVHRSVATGEVVFGRSDIDLLLVIRREAAYDGEALAALYRLMRRVQRINPALNHIDVYEPDGIGRIETCLGSSERRSCILMAGRPVDFPTRPVERDDAVGRFALWGEWFFAVAVQQRNLRNVRKTALEAWNAYAVADGLIEEPLLRRSDMEAHLRATEGEAAVRALGDPATAAAFVFGLAERLHRSRLPELRKLSAPLAFETVVAPLGMRRPFVVVPRADSPLPPEVFSQPTVFPCTPELLHLHMNYKSAFMSWGLPAELLDLGMKLPGIDRYVQSSRAFNDDRFLRHPGFAVRKHAGPWVVTACIRHALASMERGEIPPPLPRERVLALMTGVDSMEDYYRSRYPALRREVDELRTALDALVA